MRIVDRLDSQLWPGIHVIPKMSMGATDGSDLRNAGIPTYGHSRTAGDIDDNRARGQDERILANSFNEARQCLYRLVKAISSDPK